VSEAPSVLVLFRDDLVQDLVLGLTHADGGVRLTRAPWDRRGPQCRITDRAADDSGRERWGPVGRYGHGLPDAIDRDAVAGAVKPGLTNDGRRRVSEVHRRCRRRRLTIALARWRHATARTAL
jgi:hypothetical protein